MAKEIKLTRGKVAIVDDDDFEKLSSFSWCCGSDGYAVGRVFGKITKMHRLITNCPSDRVVDHINNNKLDNKKKNLQVITIKQNNRKRDICQSLEKLLPELSRQGVAHPYMHLITVAPDFALCTCTTRPTPNTLQIDPACPVHSQNR